MTRMTVNEFAHECEDLAREAIVVAAETGCDDEERASFAVAEHAWLRTRALEILAVGDLSHAEEAGCNEWFDPSGVLAEEGADVLLSRLAHWVMTGHVMDMLKRLRDADRGGL